MSNKTALVIDDSKSARFALRRHLEQHAYTVDTAESAEEAYAFLKTHHPQVIFLDHVMPGTDGFTALRQIKSNPETVSIPVVICSSNEGPEFCAEAHSKGAISVLQKPPTPEQLTQVLASLQTLAQELKSAPRSEPPAPAVASATGSKVTNLREPDVTIGQAVMNAIRNTLAQPAAEAPATAAAAVAAPAPAASAAVTAAASTAVEPTASAASRDPSEARLKKLTQDLYAQISEMRATLSLVESRVREPEEEQAVLQSYAERALQELNQRIADLEQRTDERLADMHAQITNLLVAQSQHLEQMEHSIRTVAAEAAHEESERTVMSAAARIADQLADSILKALGRK